MYRAAMTAARVPAAKIALIHAAVRAFGWPAYRAANAGTFAETAGAHGDAHDVDTDG